jgi:hypothetical protein
MSSFSKVVLACFVAIVVGATSSVLSLSASQGAGMKPAGQAGAMKMMSDADKIKSALSAAPAAIAKNAAVMDMDEKTMAMKPLKAGTNGWTCFPDLVSTPGPDPMCVDKNGLDWAAALIGHKDPPKDKMALAYMLVGATDPSNTDPWAEKPADGKWIVTGPHMMVLNIGEHFAGYPTTAADTSVPYVMFPGTPYAHLMVPVK